MAVQSEKRQCTRKGKAAIKLAIGLQIEYTENYAQRQRFDCRRSYDPKVIRPLAPG